MNIVFNKIGSLRRLAIVGLVSLSLWGATLVAPAQAADANDYYTNEIGSVQTTERYDKIQTSKGGMNGFDAVDPRRNANEAKAQELLDVAKRRKAMASDPLEPTRETLDGIKNNIVNKADELTDEAADRLNTVENKLESATDRLGKKVGDAANRFGEAVDDTNERIGDRVEQAIDEIAD